MAKVMPWQIAYPIGTTEIFTQSYWRAVQVNLCKENKTGNIMFYGFPDEHSKGARQIDQKSYAVDAAAYDTYFSPTAIDPLNVNHVSQAYLFADSVLDTDGPLGQDGKPTKVSFFAGATDA